MTGEAAKTAHKPGIGVIGGGAWGTALAQVMASDGRDVAIWAREAEVVDAINLEHVNPLFLPGIPLHANIRATVNLLATDGMLVKRPLLVGDDFAIPGFREATWTEALL